MSEVLIVAILTALTTIINLGINVLNKRKLKNVHEDINGKLTELVNTIGKYEFEKGISFEKERQDELRRRQLEDI